MRDGKRRFLAVFLTCAVAVAQERAKPVPLGHVAEKVLAAFKAKDGKSIASLAAREMPDPWVVADELCRRGGYDAAEAFARAAPRKDVEKLPAYVASRRGKPANTVARKALAKANRALRARDWQAALATLEAVDATVADLVSVRILYGRGFAAYRARRLERSAKAFLAAADAAQRLGWFAKASSAFHSAGLIAYYRSDWRFALAAWERRLALEESRANRTGVAAVLVNIGSIHKTLGSYAKALECQERALELMKALGDRSGEAAALSSFGTIHSMLGSLAKALEYQQRALELREALGDRAGVARTLGNIGNTYQRLGSYVKALKYQERALARLKALGDRAGVAAVLGNMGNTHRRLGSYAKALEYQQRALEARRALGDRAGVAGTLVNIGLIHKRLGSFAKALEYQERALELTKALGDRVGMAAALLGIGSIHDSLGSYAKALEYQARALRLSEALRDRVGVARTLGDMGNAHYSLGASAKALEYQEWALKIHEALNNRASVAVALVNIGNIHVSLGSYAKALEYQERALALSEAMNDRAGVAGTLGNIGNIHGQLGSHAKALEYYERAVALAAELGSVEIEVMSLSNLARAHWMLERPREAARAARRAVAKLPLLVEGLAEEQGATARDQWAGLLEHGVLAGVQLGDPAEVSFFLESGRAGALLESLGGRKALGDAVVPEDLRREEQAARAVVLEAQARLGRARQERSRKEIRAARAELEAARGTVLDVVAKVQRAAKAAANVVYPEAAPLPKIQAALAADEALVSYAVFQDAAVALVVTREGARIVRLAKVEEMLLRLGDPKSVWEGAVGRLRKAVVTPLGLGKETKRLLVSAAGALAYVPFVVLAPDREVVYVPSGTTYTVLLDERAKRGKEVLALGDPDYGAKRDSHASAIYRSAERGGLAALPGTRKEATAVGDVVLLGARASEASFLGAVRGKERWRAVHFACHGLVNMERPQLSSLALTPDKSNDGFLTVLEVFSMKIPADLVVLSACETARGKMHKAEGIMGFTRSFMLAGAPRVMVSLWKVDDEATRALMVKFYELWKPGRLATATALKRAQEFVRSHEKWRHPYYWAAWQLWGLPD